MAAALPRRPHKSFIPPEQGQWQYHSTVVNWPMSHPYPRHGLTLAAEQEEEGRSSFWSGATVLRSEIRQASFSILA